MAAENYVSDISRYIKSKTPPDLTLCFGKKRWDIHKGIASAHSEWFEKAVTIGFEETKKGLITLKDDAKFSDAIACMVSYFYDAAYKPFDYETNNALLHAQVAIIADKYGCVSLFLLSDELFVKSLAAVYATAWVDIAKFVYEHTSVEVLNHRNLRAHLVSSLGIRPLILNAVLAIKGFQDSLRLNADMATDILLGSVLKPVTKDKEPFTLLCRACRFIHIGPTTCSSMEKFCPGCGKRDKWICFQFNTVDEPCKFCEGKHNTVDTDDEDDDI